MQRGVGAVNISHVNQLLGLQLMGEFLVLSWNQILIEIPLTLFMFFLEIYRVVEFSMSVRLADL